jgi:hypothetical protein
MNGSWLRKGRRTNFLTAGRFPIRSRFPLVAAVYDRRKVTVGTSATATCRTRVTACSGSVTGRKAPFLIGNVTV